jgi:hypothetical protein
MDLPTVVVDNDRVDVILASRLVVAAIVFQGPNTYVRDQRNTFLHL